MRDLLPRRTSLLRRTIVLAVCSALLSSCTAAMDPEFQTGAPGYNASETAPDGQVQAQVMVDTGVLVDDATAQGDAAPTTTAGEDGALPTQVAALPSANPQNTDPASTRPATDAAATPSPTGQAQPVDATSTGTTPAAETPAAAGDPDATQPATEQSTAPAPAAPVAKPAPLAFGRSSDRGGPIAIRATPRAATAPAAPAVDAASPQVDPATAGDGSIATAADVAPAKPKQKGSLAAFFGNRSGTAADRDSSGPTVQVARAAPAAKSAKTEIDLTVAEDAEKRSAAYSSGADALPGVRQSALFEIKRRSGVDDDADVDIYEEEDYGPVQMASAAGMARLAPNGLRVQTETVDVACLKPSLVRVLKQMERHYGKAMVVTSGYRSPSRNRRARGAKNSLHMYCAAADVQIPGVGKWELASYARSMAGRGGIGTYCHTSSVHVDVGPERDWNWRCRGRRK